MGRIVIADDDATVRLLVAAKLTRAGHEVFVVGDGAAAVEECVARAPDVLILDVMMPGSGGLDAARTLRRDPRMDRMSIILLTARGQEADVEEGFEAGADGYVLKPFSPRELASQVAAVLARPR